jgi:hypothetical protein
MASDAASCVVIGGGMAGLIAAATLQQQGIHPIVLDKGYGIGGRLASRRIETPSGKVGLFDYGAQHFTANTPAFQAWVDDWLQQGIVKAWSQGFAGNAENFRPRPHYCGVTSNRAIAEHLAQTLQIHKQQKVVHLNWRDNHWEVYTEQGDAFRGDTVLLTPPVPQTLELLKNAGIPVPAPLQQRLQAVTYTPCLAVLARLAEPSIIPAPGGLLLDGEPLQWIASNHQKGICPQGDGVTLLGGGEFSQQYWGAEKTAIATHLIEAAQPWLPSPVMAHHVHRWKYSQPLVRFGEPFVLIERPGPLLLAGDGFGPATAASNVEGAALSGLAAAQAISG